jgi:protein-S-isoprenylcysteine O-methyltransferase Ste14
MLLNKRFEASGNLLFRWRSYLPLLWYGILFAAVPNFSYLFGRHLFDLLWEILCLHISFFGFALRIVTVGYTPKKTSGRNTRKGQVAEYLNTTGMYSIVRNPLYLGNFFIGLGISLFLHVWWIALIYILLFILFYERIVFAEEQFLTKKFAHQYLDWASITPAFFPKCSLWHPSELPFSFKKAIRKEYHGFMSIILIMFVLETVTDAYIYHSIIIDPVWICILAFAAVLYVTIRILHKWTSFLKTPRR